MSLMLLRPFARSALSLKRKGIRLRPKVDDEYPLLVVMVGLPTGRRELWGVLPLISYPLAAAEALVSPGRYGS